MPPCDVPFSTYEVMTAVGLVAVAGGDIPDTVNLVVFACCHAMMSCPHEHAGLVGASVRVEDASGKDQQGCSNQSRH